VRKRMNDGHQSRSIGQAAFIEGVRSDTTRYGMIPKSGNRFSDKIMLKWES
jgi:hypothetical protein